MSCRLTIEDKENLVHAGDADISLGTLELAEQWIEEQTKESLIEVMSDVDWIMKMDIDLNSLTEKQLKSTAISHLVEDPSFVFVAINKFMNFEPMIVDNAGRTL